MCGKNHSINNHRQHIPFSPIRSHGQVSGLGESLPPQLGPSHRNGGRGSLEVSECFQVFNSTRHCFHCFGGVLLGMHQAER